MNIDGPTLQAQFRRAQHDWPFIDEINKQYGLPPFCLYAVGSRETNLTNEIGDGGHGNGVWQLDNRSHTIPPGFNQNVALQAKTAAVMLNGLISQFGIKGGFAAYNAGAGTVQYNIQHGLDVDTGTAGGDYGKDTSERMIYLAKMNPLPTEGAEMQFVFYGNADKAAPAIAAAPGRWVNVNKTTYLNLIKSGAAAPKITPLHDAELKTMRGVYMP